MKRERTEKLSTWFCLSIVIGFSGDDSQSGVEKRKECEPLMDHATNYDSIMTLFTVIMNLRRIGKSNRALLANALADVIIGAMNEERKEKDCYGIQLLEVFKWSWSFEVKKSWKYSWKLQTFSFFAVQTWQMSQQICFSPVHLAVKLLSTAAKQRKNLHRFEFIVRGCAQQQ